MKHKSLIVALAFPFICSAQTDSSVIYISKSGKLTTKDSAFIYSIKTKHNNLWHVVTYFSSNNKLQSEGDFADDDLLKPVGKFDNYLEDGTLNTTCNYVNGLITDKTYYYKDGKKKSFIAYNSGGVLQQKGWDENGKEIAGFIVEQEAKFKGSWNKYLEKKLDARAVSKSGMPPGLYTVTVAFVVSPDGSITDVKIDSDPGHCTACAAEAFNIISNAPAWQPAIQNNEPVAYRQKQNISFQLTENKKGKKD